MVVVGRLQVCLSEGMKAELLVIPNGVLLQVELDFSPRMLHLLEGCASPQSTVFN